MEYKWKGMPLVDTFLDSLTIIYLCLAFFWLLLQGKFTVFQIYFLFTFRVAFIIELPLRIIALGPYYYLRSHYVISGFVTLVSTGFWIHDISVGNSFPGPYIGSIQVFRFLGLLHALGKFNVEIGILLRATVKSIGSALSIIFVLFNLW